MDTSFCQGRFCLHVLHAMHVLELAKKGYSRLKMGAACSLILKFIFVQIGRNKVPACP